MATEQPTPGRCNRKTANGYCEKWPIKGGDVCATHGGAAPQVKAAAARRLQEQQALAAASRMMARDGVDDDPIAHLLDSLHQAKAQLYVWGVMVAALDERAEEEAEDNGWLRGELAYSEIDDRDNPDTLAVRAHDRLVALTAKGEAKVHPYVEEFNKALERRAKFAKMCVDAGVAEHQVRLLERQIEIAAKALDATLDKLGLDATRQQEARATYARELRLVVG